MGTRAPGAQERSAFEIRRGIFRGFGTRHVVLLLVFAIAYDVLGQLGWIEFNPQTFARRLHGFKQFPVHLAIVFGAGLCAVAAENIFHQERLRRARYFAAVLVASVAGAVIVLLWTNHFRIPSEKEMAALAFVGEARPQLLVWVFLRAAYISVLVVALHAVFESSRRASADLHAARIAALAARHELVEGELRATQARVDPELLFESLRRLDAAYARDVASGQHRLDKLIHFLRAALPGDTTSASTVARETELAEAFVALTESEEDPRASQKFGVDTMMLQEEMPSMLLLPLVRWALAGGSSQCLRVNISRGERSGEGAAGDGGNRRQYAVARLKIVVENLAIDADPVFTDGEVDIVRGRLDQLYADRALLQVQHDGNRRRAVLELPVDMRNRSNPRSA